MKTQPVEAKSIMEFTEEDVVVQVMRSETGDGSYFGIPMKILGIVNNEIHMEVLKESFPWEVGARTKLDLQRWGNCWAIYVDPKDVIGEV